MGRVTNDLAEWFPVLLGTGVRVPKTFIFKTDAPLISLFDGEHVAGFDELVSEIAKACEEIGYPAFLRSGQTSAKHDWENTCLLKSKGEIEDHIAAIVEYGECASLIGLPYDTWVVREMLPVDPVFTAFMEMPITKERRYFIEAGKVICHHPYWPEEAFVNQYVSRDDWHELLATMNLESEEEIAELTALSEKVSAAFEGAWSLDWLWTKRGWVAIDMATAESSYHWNGCNRSEQPA